MRCFIANERTALDDMWQRLSKDYYIDPDLTLMLVESLGSYLYIRWYLEQRNEAHHIDVYLDDLMEAALLTHIPRNQILACWDQIYRAVHSSLWEFHQKAGTIRGVNPLLENHHLLGLMVFS